MQLVILHYHLNPGGVRQVILNHLRSLGRDYRTGWPERVAILFGGRRHGWPEAVFTRPPPFPIELVDVPLLDYDTKPIADADGLARHLHTALAEHGFDSDNTILHCHNHALGKNASLPGALSRLARDGYRLLLQIHDFAEDFRPENYRHLATALKTNEPNELAGLLYPQGPGIHYAVLTHRDRAVLAAAGIADERLHLLPNPIAEFVDLPDRESARAAVRRALAMPADARLVVYPVRGIRRKNVGEMLLVSALGNRQTTYAITLSPINPVERTSFDHWRRLSDRLDLPCRFDTGGAGLRYPDMLTAADALLSTSVAEGFGMVFLEAWLAGRPLVGRNLRDVTADFVDHGVCFPWMYDELSIPKSWLNERELEHELAHAYRAVCSAYGIRTAADQKLSRQIGALVAGESVDFAVLPPKLQSAVIERVGSYPTEAAELLAAEGKIAAVGQAEPRAARDVILANAQLIRRHYSFKAIGERLRAAYQAVAESPPSDPLESLPAGAAILGTFLDVRRLHPIRVQ